LLENVIENVDFALMMKRNIEDMVIHFFEKAQNFAILCNIEEVVFEPELPHDINKEFRPLTIFFLGGYTFETARIEDDVLIFEAGFGSDNFGSLVHVPLLSIMQIIIGETPVLINLATSKSLQNHKLRESVDEDGVKNSMASFLSNPENSKFLKK